MRILLAVSIANEERQEIGYLIMKSLQQNGHEVTRVHEGIIALIKIGAISEDEELPEYVITEKDLDGETNGLFVIEEAQKFKIPAILFGGGFDAETTKVTDRFGAKVVLTMGLLELLREEGLLKR